MANQLRVPVRSKSGLKVEFISLYFQNIYRTNLLVNGFIYKLVINMLCSSKGRRGTLIPSSNK